MKAANLNKNLSFLEFKRYENEIYLDTYDKLIKTSVINIKKSVAKLGTNELHHIVKYYQKMVLNTLFFNDKKILFEYHKWLYRVYFHRGIDLDFFAFLVDSFQNKSNIYLKKEISVQTDELFKYIMDKHQELKETASKKKFLIDNELPAKELANILINGDTKKAYGLCKENAPSIDGFIKYYNEVISNAMKYIGYMWESDDISVAKEHVSSNTLNDTLMKLLDEYPKNEDRDIHIFLSSAPNELHGLGVKIASKIFEKQGFKVTNIGTNIPSKEIRKAILEFSPDIIILTATLPSSLLDIALLIDEIQKDKAIFITPFKIGIAGSGFENMIHPAKTCKADFYMNSLDDLFLYI